VSTCRLGKCDRRSELKNEAAPTLRNALSTKVVMSILERLRNRIHAKTRNLTHIELLVMLVAIMVIQSVLESESRAERIVLNLSLFGLVLSGIRSLSSSRSRTSLAIAFGVTALVASLLTEISDSGPLVDISYVCYLLVLLLLLTALSESVFSLGPTSLDRIVGAISIYFVMVLAWAFAYALLEVHRPESFLLTEDVREGINPSLINEMFYFSATTLTTLGYGDVVALSKPARTLAVLEAMSGQMYVAVVIAYLVGQHISERVREQTHGERRDQDDP
jgi:hypothetical protein